MTDHTPSTSYHQTLRAANALSAKSLHTPLNYFSTLSIRTGTLAGIVGSLIIMVMLGALTVSATMDTWFAPRFIASIFIGENAWTGSLPILLGTVVHLATGAFYGALFAFALPALPRAFWFVAGIVYGVALWALAAYILPTLAETDMMNNLLYTNALVVSHIVFGITLGIGGSFFGQNRS